MDHTGLGQKVPEVESDTQSFKLQEKILKSHDFLFQHIEAGVLFGFQENLLSKPQFVNWTLMPLILWSVLGVDIHLHIPRNSVTQQGDVQ